MNKLSVKILSVAASVGLLAGSFPVFAVDESYSAEISISSAQGRKLISPNIYGVSGIDNDAISEADALRVGGPRYVLYNWQNNCSTAGVSTHTTNGRALGTESSPAQAATGLYSAANERGINFTLLTLSMSPYVAADGNGPILAEQNAPGERWVNQYYSKSDAPADAPFNSVYTEDYLKYITNSFSKASSGGISAYSLDYETSLRNEVYPSVFSSKPKIDDFFDNSEKLAATIRRSDETALIFGGEFSGMNDLMDFNGAEDWIGYKANFKWFVDCYLTKMKQASQKNGRRLIDALSLHFVSDIEAEGVEHSVTGCTDKSHTECAEARVQAPRILYDGEYYAENPRYRQYVPLIPTLQASINSNYSGTKLAFTEYSFGGGGDISGAVAEADALGAFAGSGVYLACLSDLGQDMTYQTAALKLFTDYDGNGSGFGSTSVSAECDAGMAASAYASIEDTDDSIIKLVVINKDPTRNGEFTIKIDSKCEHYSAESYSIDRATGEVKKGSTIISHRSNRFACTTAPMSVNILILSGEKVDDNEGSVVSDSSEAMTESSVVTSTTEISGEEEVSVQENTNDSSPIVTVVSEPEPVNQQKEVNPVFKMLVIVLISLTAIGSAYLIIIDLIKPKRR